MKGRTPETVTLKQVAEKAGVSVTAASSVLNRNNPNIRISADKAQLIQKVAQDLHYVPNGLASSLRTNRTQNIGLVFENFGAITDGMFYVELLDGVAQELFKHKYRLTILPEVDRKSPLTSLGNGTLDGVIWCKLPQSTDVLEILKHSTIPFIALHARPSEGHEATAYVSSDNFGGAKMAVRHLAELGHTKILFVLEEFEEDVPDSVARLEGFLAGCKDLGIPSGEADVQVWSRDMTEFDQWNATRPPHTAIIAWNERSAAAILSRCRENGVPVPGRYSVMGFDSTPFADMTVPPLTCIHQPIRQMAGTAVQLLLDRLNCDNPVKDVEFPMGLDVRASTGPARPSIFTA